MISRSKTIFVVTSVLGLLGLSIYVMISYNTSENGFLEFKEKAFSFKGSAFLSHKVCEVLGEPDEVSSNGDVTVWLYKATESQWIVLKIDSKKSVVFDVGEIIVDGELRMSTE